MSQNTWDTAKSVRNGGTVSLAEVAALWKSRPYDSFYAKTPEPSNKWITPEFLASMRAV